MVAAGFLVLSIASILLNDVNHQINGLSLIWLPNALLIGIMLCVPRKQWPAYLALGFVIDISINVVTGTAPSEALFLTLCNSLEVLVACATIAPAMPGCPDLHEPRQMGRLMVCGMVLAPAVSSWLAAWYRDGASSLPSVVSFRFWFASDALGIAMIAPLYLSFRQQTRFSARSWLEVTGLFVLVGGLSLAVFRLSSYPTLWLLMLALLLVGVRLGFRGSSLALLMVTFIGGYMTLKGFGPLRADAGNALTSRVEFFQFFLAASMLALYATEMAMAGSRRVLTKLASSEIRFRSLAEASRDIIVLVDLRGHRRYVSPAMTELLGWSAEQLVDQTFGELAHPEDEEKVGLLLDELWAGQHPPPLTYRCRRKDRTYLWMEATARLLHDGQSGEPSGFVFVLRDIADRKIAEDALKEAFAKVEALAMQDGLTGVANRRLLDHTLEQEWLRGLRDGTPLSVVLIDVDHFKKYNDHYGHLAGDACLRRVATEVAAVLRRPPDLLARFGGEEFVAVLPNTPAAGAETVSEMLRRTVEDCQVPHCGNSFGVLTVSLGCATAVPSMHSSVAELLKAADEALYRAKEGGRNQARSARAELVSR